MSLQSILPRIVVGVVGDEEINKVLAQCPTPMVDLINANPVPSGVFKDVFTQFRSILFSIASLRTQLAAQEEIVSPSGGRMIKASLTVCANRRYLKDHALVALIGDLII